MKNNRNLSITVGIPTCYSGTSIVKTVEIIRNADLGNTVKIIINADRTPISAFVVEKLKKLNAEVMWNTIEGSQMKKVKQLVEKIDCDIFISTQDDIIFDKNTISEIYKAFENDSSLTMAGIRFLPLKPVNFFEKAMAVMQNMVDKIAGSWKGGDNMYSASGRCLAFKTSAIKEFRIPNEIVNGDTFFYFENIRNKGNFKRLGKAKVYIRCPQNIKDQIGPSSRYQYSNEELQKYFEFDISNEYKIPASIMLKTFAKEFFNNPISCSFYALIRIYTRIVKLSKNDVVKTSWAVDTSTKSV